MYLPKFIYESLPALYVILGFCNVIYFYHILPSKLGMFSGAILLLAAYVINNLRKMNRGYNG